MHGFPLMPGDLLRLRAYNVYGVTTWVTVLAVTIDSSGASHITSLTCRGFAEGVVQEIPLPVGELMLVSVENVNGSASLGDDVHFTLDLSRPSLGATPFLCSLCEGSLATGRTMGWIFGAGAVCGLPMRKLRVYQVTDPAAGANVALSVSWPGNWEIVNVRCQLVTNGVAGTRMVYLGFYDPNGNVFLYPAGNSQGPSLTKDYRWDRDVSPNWSVGSFLMAPMPYVQVHGTLRLTTVITNLDAGDQVTGLWLTLRPLQ